MDFVRLKQTEERLTHKSEKIIGENFDSRANQISCNLLNNIRLSTHDSPRKEDTELAIQDIYLLNFYIKLLEQYPQVRGRELSNKVSREGGIIDVHGHIRKLKKDYRIRYS